MADATYRYPSNISSNGSYMIFVAYKNEGWKTEQLQKIDQVNMKLSSYSSIGLPIPNNLQDSTSLSYSDIQDSNLTGMVAQNLIDKHSPDKATQIGKLKEGAAIAQQQTQIFNGVNAKIFTFNWSLIPETPSDANTISEIIKIFELAKLPSWGFNNSVMHFPDLFKISFGGKQPKLLKYLPSVITQIECNYAPGNHFQMYEDGNFPQIDLSITFSEFVSRTREIQTSLYRK